MTSELRSGFEVTKAARDEALNQARSRLILDGAWRVFARNGLESATMRAIAAEAGCTTGAIYPIFSSKEVIYAALLAESLGRLRDRVSSAFEEESDPSSRLKAAALAFLNYYRDRPGEVSLGLYLWNGLKPKSLSAELDGELNLGLNATLEFLRRAIAGLGEMSEAEIRLEANTLFAFLIGTLIVHQTGRLRMLGTDIDDLTNNHLDAVVLRLTSRRPSAATPR